MAIRTILPICLLLISLGLIALVSADSMGRMINQLQALGLAVLACGFTVAMGYRRLEKFIPLMVVGTVGLLVLVLFMRPINGSHRWIPITSGLNFQPGELAKLVTLIALASWLCKVNRQAVNLKRGFVIPVAGLCFVAALLVVEPDYGTAALIFLVGVTVMFLAGTNWRYLISAGVLGAMVMSLFVFTDYERTSRIKAWLFPERYADTDGYQALQSMYAFQSGGLTGVGYGQGLQKHGFVPEDHTDFILSVLGQELGFFATTGVILLFLLFFACGMIISYRCHHRFGRLLGIGITLMITTQAAINIGVVTGLLPTKGFTLPFMSYGGSHILVTGLMVGVLISISRDVEEPTDIEEAIEKNLNWNGSAA